MHTIHVDSSESMVEMAFPSVTSSTTLNTAATATVAIFSATKHSQSSSDTTGTVQTSTCLQYTSELVGESCSTCHPQHSSTAAVGSSSSAICTNVTYAVVVPVVFMLLLNVIAFGILLVFVKKRGKNRC